MPNTPAAIGRGITVAVPLHANEAQRDLAHRLLLATGTVEWITDEALMDAVTAVSGSGPAYVFLLAEALAQAGVAAGLAAAVLREQLARETVAGAGELLHQSALDAATLRENVTSPGGTTAAALDVLMATNGLARLLNEAVRRRHRTLARACGLSAPRRRLGTARARTVYTGVIAASSSSRRRASSRSSAMARKPARKSARSLPRVSAPSGSRRRRSREDRRGLSDAVGRQRIRGDRACRYRRASRRFACAVARRISPRRSRSWPHTSRRPTAPCLPPISATWPRSPRASACSMC